MQAMLSAIDVNKLFDFIAVRLDPVLVGLDSRPRWTIVWEITDTQEVVRQMLSNCTLLHTTSCDMSVLNKIKEELTPYATVRLDRETLLALALANQSIDGAVQAKDAVVGGADRDLPKAMFAMLTRFDMQFDVMGVGVDAPVWSSSKL
eukprot:COSAG01_NODE_3398_length_6144_cov_24.119438_3_plen_148_part_00